MKEILLKRQWEIEDKIKHLQDEVYRLLSEMYHDPDKAWEHAVETADDPRAGVDGTIAVLKKSPRDFGKPRFPRVGKESQEKVTKFRENRQELIKVLRDLPYEKGRIDHVKSGLEEIERTDNEDKVKEPPTSPKQSPGKTKEKPEYMVEREAEREAIKAQMQQERAEREANRATITPQKVRVGQNQQRDFVEPQPEKGQRDTPVQFAQKVKNEQQLADERVAIEQEQPHQLVKDEDRSEVLQAKIRKELEQARERRELERDDDDLER